MKKIFNIILLIGILYALYLLIQKHKSNNKPETNEDFTESNETLKSVKFIYDTERPIEKQFLKEQEKGFLSNTWYPNTWIERIDENGNPVYNSRENVTGVKEDFVEDKSRFTYEFNSPRSVQMDGVADPNDFKNGNGRTLQEVYDKSFVDYKDMIPNKSKREIEADQMNTQKGGSNLSFISPDTWIYEQEKPENGGIIANGLTAFDPLSFNSTANTLAVIDYKN